MPRAAFWDELDRRDALTAVALALFSIGFYARTTGFDFVDMDEVAILIQHPNLYDETSFLASLHEIFVRYLPREEPLFIRDVSWALDARIYGFSNAFGYHLGNVLCNALVVSLLFVFLRRTTRSFVVAAGVASAFSLLPIHVEPVAWVMGRKDLLVAIFTLLALLAQSVELGANEKRTRRLAFGLALISTALALGSKPSGMSLFLVLGVHRVFHPYLEGGAEPRTAIDWRATLRRTLPATIPHAILCLGFFAWYRHILSQYGVIGDNAPGPTDPEHLGNVLLFLPLIAGEYLKSLLWPHDLSVYYRWPNVVMPIGGALVASAIAWATGIVSIIGLLLWRRRDLAFFALWTGALMLPYSGLFYVGFWHADRYFYLASAGILTLLAILLRELASRTRLTRLAAAGLVAVFLISNAGLAWLQQTIWLDPMSLWHHETQLPSPSLLASQGIARVYLAQATASSGAERAEWLARSRTEIERALAEQAPAFAVPSRYRLPERAQLAKLHVYLGQIALLGNRPAAERLAHYRRAFEISNSGLSAMLVSDTLFEMADAEDGSEQKRLVEESFAYLLAFLETARNDSVIRAYGHQKIEERYVGRFPYLDRPIAQARKNYF